MARTNGDTPATADLSVLNVFDDEDYSDEIPEGGSRVPFFSKGCPGVYLVALRKMKMGQSQQKHKRTHVVIEGEVLDVLESFQGKKIINKDGVVFEFGKDVYWHDKAGNPLINKEHEVGKTYALFHDEKTAGSSTALREQVMQIGRIVGNCLPEDLRKAVRAGERMRHLFANPTACDGLLVKVKILPSSAQTFAKKDYTTPFVADPELDFIPFDDQILLHEKAENGEGLLVALQEMAEAAAK